MEIISEKLIQIGIRGKGVLQGEKTWMIHIQYAWVIRMFDHICTFCCVYTCICNIFQTLKSCHSIKVLQAWTESSSSLSYSTNKQCKNNHNVVNFFTVKRQDYLFLVYFRFSFISLYIKVWLNDINLKYTKTHLTIHVKPLSLFLN